MLVLTEQLRIDLDFDCSSTVTDQSGRISLTIPPFAKKGDSLLGTKTAYA